MPELTATKVVQQRFWDGFCRALPSDTSLACLAWDPSMGHAINVAEGQHFELTLRFNVRDRRIEADLTLKGHSAKSNFGALRSAFRAESELKLGAGAEWQPEVPQRPNYPRPRLPEAHVRIKRPDVKPTDEELWPEYWSWLRERADVLNGWRTSISIA
jgi:hypothetical protein